MACLGFGGAFLTVKKRAVERQREDADKIETLSNKWVKVSSDLDEQRQVNAILEKDVDSQKKVLTELTNNYAQVAANLSQAEASIKSNEEELRKRDAKISELETQNQALDKQALTLSTEITNLTVKIDDTRKKLASSEGDRAFLEGELKRLMSEKAELERQFNDLSVLRAQVAKLKEEMSIARRIEWIRQGLFASAEQKGAQKLMQGVSNPQNVRARGNYDLNVEVSSDGTVKVIPPLTNSPARSASPPK